MFEKPKDKNKLPKSDLVSVKPLRDFHIVHNDVDLKLIKGESMLVNKMFIQNLKTEKVIK